MVHIYIILMHCRGTYELYKAWHFTYSIELETPVINIMKCATKVESRKFTESHDTVKAFCGCGLG